MGVVVMLVKLTEAELAEAVREWCERRGIPATHSDVSFKARSNAAATTADWSFEAIINNIVIMPNGPYR